MASNGVDPSTGAPRFPEEDAPQTGADYEEVADWAAFMGTRPIGTTTERADWEYVREGLLWRDLTTGLEYEWSGSGWVPVRARVVGRVKRSGAATTFPSSGYTNVSGNSFWAADAAQGVSAYDGCWTAPVAGRYMVSYEIRANGSFLAGVAVNYSGPTPNLVLASTSTTVQTIAATTVCAPLKLAAGDELRLYLLASTGTPAWVAGVGSFGLEWVGAD